MNSMQQSVSDTLFRMARLAEQDADLSQAFAQFLDQGLDELQADDAFGTEGQLDPRGDFRDGRWRAEAAQPLTSEEQAQAHSGQRMSPQLLHKVDSGDSLSDDNILTALSYFTTLEDLALCMGPAGHMVAEHATRRAQRMRQYAVARNLIER